MRDRHGLGYGGDRGAWFVVSGAGRVEHRSRETASASTADEVEDGGGRRRWGREDATSQGHLSAGRRTIAFSQNNASSTRGACPNLVAYHIWTTCLIVCCCFRAPPASRHAPDHDHGTLPARPPVPPRVHCPVAVRSARDTCTQPLP